ncbi:MAG: hypothetical protein R3C39_01695 [Dehalococcoidia bacterium]
MKKRPSRRYAPFVGLAWIVAVAALAAACGSDAPGNEGASTGAGDASAAATASAPARATAEVTSAFPFPTGPAVLVPAGYEPPGDIVDSTGAYLPANGKPTLVYVDAIW